MKSKQKALEGGGILEVLQLLADGVFTITVTLAETAWLVSGKVTGYPWRMGVRVAPLYEPYLSHPLAHEGRG